MIVNKMSAFPLEQWKPSAYCVTTSASIRLYIKVQGECVVTLANTGNIPIKYIEATSNSNMNMTIQKRMY